MKTYLIILLILPVSLIGQSNKIFKAVYQYHKILTEKEKAKEDSLIKYDAFYRSMIDFKKQNNDNKKLIMFFNDSTSIYYQEYIDKNPEIVNSFYEISIKEKLYKNLNEKKYWQNKQIFNEYFTITDSLPDYQWKISNENKKIGQYLVVKATGEETILVRKNGKIIKIRRDLTAWFCPEIPVQNGPDLYWGLPGLIMEISSKREIYMLKELYINPKKSEKIIKPKINKMQGDLSSFYKESDRINKKMKKRFKNRRKRGKDWWKN